jgi:hypothetical protein
MRILKYMVAVCGLGLLGFGVVLACGHDSALREYLDVRFWLPFEKHGTHFEKPGIKRVSTPYAGMFPAQGNAVLANLRRVYQRIAFPQPDSFDTSIQRQAVEAARAEGSLTARERDEIDLIDAKVDIRAGSTLNQEPLVRARAKLEKFLKAARTTAFVSEARGWLAYVHRQLGNPTAAGKIYIDELNRSGSNLSRETLLDSLQINYGYDGGQDLLDHLEEYFDTPEHAAFAVQLLANPHWIRYPQYNPRYVDRLPKAYPRIRQLLAKNQALLESNTGSNALALLLMRVSLRMGDAPGALAVAEGIPESSAVRSEPDFNWMLGSVYFLLKKYDQAEGPLLRLFESSKAADSEKAAAAYGLCGVYQKLHNPVEQLRFALWLWGPEDYSRVYESSSDVEDRSVYWANSGWDLGIILEQEASMEVLKAFIEKYPMARQSRLVKYAIATRLARENRYDESARMYASIGVTNRAARMRQVDALYRAAYRSDAPGPQVQEARYRLAEFIGTHSERVYFNDTLWYGFQRPALSASTDSRLTLSERETMMSAERKLLDEQEERWRAYLILRDVVRDSGKSTTGRKAAQLALQFLRGISGRFDRSQEIFQADLELIAWLRQN